MLCCSRFIWRWNFISCILCLETQNIWPVNFKEITIVYWMWIGYGLDMCIKLLLWLELGPPDSRFQTSFVIFLVAESQNNFQLFCLPSPNFPGAGPASGCGGHPRDQFKLLCDSRPQITSTLIAPLFPTPPSSCNIFNFKTISEMEAIYLSSNICIIVTATLTDKRKMARITNAE